jgi:hypothetical protein
MLKLRFTLTALKNSFGELFTFLHLKRILILSFSIFLTLASEALAKTRSIYVVEIIPHHSEEYAVNQELRQIEHAIDLALKHHFRLKQCKIAVHKVFRKGNEHVLSETLDEIKKKDPDAILLGLSRSNSARLAAKLTTGSALIGVSVGSAAGHLNLINPLFFSIVSPIESQWAVISKEMKALKCQKSQTIGIFNPKSYFSQQFRALYSRDDLGEVYDLSSLGRAQTPSLDLQGKRCIFFGTYLSDAELMAKKIIESNWTGHLIANTDWSYFPRELHTFLKSQRKHLLQIAIPSGWKRDASSTSLQFLRQFRSLASSEPTPAAAYAYDAAFIAAELACGNLDLNLNTLSQSVHSLPLLRTYEGMSPSGHLLAPIQFLRK